MSKETLSFKIGLSGTFWDKKPKCSVLINDKVIQQLELDNEITYVEFTAEFEENTVNKLGIRLENKEDSDTVAIELDGGGHDILKDMLLNVESIEIDDISLDSLIWSASVYVPDDPGRPSLDQCVNLGWNGEYILEFTSPFYLWLLEKI
jgi:hypothetical protein